MLNSLKDASGLNFLARYFSTTKFWRKCLDALLVCLILIVYGIASGHIKLPTVETTPHHSVESSFKRSREIQKILDATQYNTGHLLVGAYKFHNGTTGLDGFNFMKYSLTEYSAPAGVHFDTVAMQSVPIVANMPLIASLVEGKCHKGTPMKTSPAYDTAVEAGIKEYIACPVTKNNYLVGFVAVAGDGKTPLPSEEEVRAIANQIKHFLD